MKKQLTLIIAVFTTVLSFSQTFNYQAAVRDNAGDLITNQAMSVQVRLLAGGPTGGEIYNEIHNVTSNAHGIIVLPVGGGTVNGNFTSFHSIGWNQGNQWIDIAVDLAGGTDFVNIGTSQLRFVPYAMYAINSSNAANANHVFGITNNVVSNESGNFITDDFVFGSFQLDNNGQYNAAYGNRMFFDKSKAAFRAGYTPQDEWDEPNVGEYSVAFGESAQASGKNSYAMGRNATAIGLETFAFGTNAGGFANYAKGFGLNARAFGVGSTAIGVDLVANSFGETQMGQYSTYVAGDANNWVPTDRLFVIGNGQYEINNALDSDAFVMLKNGNTTLNGELTLDGDNQGPLKGYTFPAQDGTSNQIIQTDGAGNLTWVTPAASAIPNGGNNGEVLSTDGSGNLSWATNDDGDADPTNEIELPIQTGASGKFLTTDGTAVSWQDVPTELPTGGVNGQVLATDGSGVYSWIDQPAGPAFSTTNNITSNGANAYGADDFIFGAPTNVTGSDVFAANRIFFDKSKAAIRVGRDIGGQNAFADANVGAYSAAFGLNPKAAGQNAFAAGFLANASGYNAVALGNTNTASGTASIAIGDNSIASGAFAKVFGKTVTAEAYGQTTLGYYNTSVAGSPTTIVPTDRLFVIGNGSVDINGVNGSDALVVLKNGNTSINGELTIDGDNAGSGASYTLPAQDGTANQIMQTDGSGAVSWVDAPSGGGVTLPAQTGQSGKVLSTDGTSPSWIDTPTELPVGGTSGQLLSTDGSGNYSWVNDATGTSGAFSTTSNVTSNANGAIATDDFVFGSTQLANNTTSTDDDARMFFDKSKGAFRVGRTQDPSTGGVGTEWDDVNVGNKSIGMGEDVIAAGLGSVAIGNNINVDSSSGFGIALGSNSSITNAIGAVSLGDSNTVSAEFGLALGLGNRVVANRGTAIGSNAHAGSYAQTSIGFTTQALGSTNSFVDTDRLFVIGNGKTSTGPSDALVMLKNGNTTLNGALTIDGDNQGTGTSYTLPAQDGSANQIMTTDGSGNVTWANVPSSATTFATVNEGNGNGYILSNRTAANYGNIGTGAFDISFSDGASSTKGATNNYSVAAGLNTSASGFASIAAGEEAVASGSLSTAIGLSAKAEGNSSVALGEFTRARSFAETVVGTNNTEPNPASATAFNANDRLFVIGNGASEAVKSDAMVVLKNGNTTINGNATVNGDIATDGIKVNSLPAFNVTNAAESTYTSLGPHEVGNWTSTLNTDLFNDGSHLNLTNGRFTAPVSGLYFFSAQLRIDAINGSGGSAYSRLMIVKNGNKQGFRNGLHSIRNADTGTANWDTQQVSGVLKLNAGDYVSVFVETTGDTNYAVQIESGFNGYLINKL